MNRNLAASMTMLVLASLPSLAAAAIVGPTSPGSLTATAGPGAGEITLAWEASSSLTGVTSYRVYHVAEDGSLALAGEVAGDRLGWTETGLAAGATVTYVATAVDALAESAPSNAATETAFSAPDAPVGVAVATGPGPVGEALVTWSAGADGGSAITGFNVYRDGALVGSTDAATTSFVDTGLTPLHAYSYTVTATNVAGESAHSGAACGMASPWIAELGCFSLA